MKLINLILEIAEKIYYRISKYQQSEVYNLDKFFL